MKSVLHRRPSASLVVSIIALVVAMSGTAIAASHLVNGDKLIKKHSLSGNRLRNHTLTGKQINLKKLGKVPSAKNADHATTADTATSATSANSATSATNAVNATNATNATNAANLAGLNRFRTTIQPAGSSFTDAAVVTLGTAGPLSLVGKCFSSGGAITGGLFLSTTAAAEYDAYDNQFNGAPLTPGTDEDVGEDDATSTPPAVDFQDPTDGTFAALTNTTGNYITGLASVATNMNSSGGCTFAGFTVAS